MDKPIVSVIVLTYKNFNYFKECIDSILTQTYPRIELMISDDGSENFDQDLIEGYINDHKKSNIVDVQIIHHPNLGTVKNYNQAIKASQGKYIVNLAIDDCFYDEFAVSNIAEFFEETKAMIVTAYREVYDEKFEKKIERLPYRKYVKTLRTNKKIYRILCKGNFFSGACTYYSKAFFEQYGLFHESYILLEDYPKYLQATRMGCPIGFLEKTTLKYRMGGISTSGNMHPLLQKDYETAIEREILPYPKETGWFIHRYSTYDYLGMQGKQSVLTKIYYVDVLSYKIAEALKNRTIRKVVGSL